MSDSREWTTTTKCDICGMWHQGTCVVPQPDPPSAGATPHELAETENRNGWTYVTCTCGWSSGPFHNAAYAQDALTHHASTATVSAGATPASEPRCRCSCNPHCGCPCHAAPPTPEPTVEQIADRLENVYDFNCEAGPLKLCVEWQQLREALATSSERVRELEQKLEFIFSSAKHSQEIAACEVCAGMEESLREDFPDWLAIWKRAEAAEAQLTLVLEMLREHEWTPGKDFLYCAICDGTERLGHKPDCWLAALLAQIGKARGKNAPRSSAGVTGTGE